MNSPSSSETTFQPILMWRLSESDCMLRRDEDAPEARVDAVAQGEIDDAIRAAEIHRWLRTLFCQGVEAFAGPASKQDDEDIVQDHRVDCPSLASGRRATGSRHEGGGNSNTRQRIGQTTHHQGNTGVFSSVHWFDLLDIGAYDQAIRILGYSLHGHSVDEEVRDALYVRRVLAAGFVVALVTAALPVFAQRNNDKQKQQTARSPQEQQDVQALVQAVDSR